MSNFHTSAKVLNIIDTRPKDNEVKVTFFAVKDYMSIFCLGRRSVGSSNLQIFKQQFDR